MFVTHDVIPCPFCNNKRVIVWVKEQSGETAELAECGNCHVKIPLAQWNKRPREEELAKKLLITEFKLSKLSAKHDKIARELSYARQMWQ